ncbi:MAG: hypothetical protein HUU45_12705, partial [Leptospiraceae bacterium]|nr:hypothetical protein [Leptospiraceae bacterium]
MKINETLLKIKPEDLEPHPWNRKRIENEDELDSKRREKLREEQIKFEESIAKSGIWESSPLLITKEKVNGKYQILRGRRRFEAVLKNIKRGKLPFNYKIPCLQMVEDTQEALREAIFGDNDQGRGYSFADRIEILKTLLPLKRLLSAEKGVAKGTGVIAELERLLPFWTNSVINKTVTHLRRLHADEMTYKEPPEEKIDNLNRLLLSILQLHKTKTQRVEKVRKEITKLEADLKKDVHKIEQEIAEYSREFGKGGYKAYLRNYLKSKRPEFQGL